MKTVSDQDVWYSENETGVKTQGQGGLKGADTKFHIGLGRKKSLQGGNI